MKTKVLKMITIILLVSLILFIIVRFGGIHLGALNLNIFFKPLIVIPLPAKNKKRVKNSASSRLFKK